MEPDSLRQILSRYDAFVRLNPRLATELESLIRWSSYLISTKRSPILGELLYSGANLLQLCNDLLIRQSIGKLSLDFEDQVVRLRTFLSVIQSFEIFAEVLARNRYGTIGRWTIITVIQITKATIKLTLLLKYKRGIQKSQPLIPIDRIHLHQIVSNKSLLESSQISLDSVDGSTSESVYHDATCEPNTSSAAGASNGAVPNDTLTLKTTGRKMRRIKNSPPYGSRFLESLKSDGPKGLLGNNEDAKSNHLKMLLQLYTEQAHTELSDTQIYGEMLHIARPLAHLAFMGMLGTQSWIPYLSSILMDLTSLHLVRSPSAVRPSIRVSGTHGGNVSEFTLRERLELGGRAQSLLLYLLRSPFFDKYTKKRALEGLSSISENIPLVGGLIGSFVSYIPEWQQDYFRLWSD